MNRMRGEWYQQTYRKLFFDFHNHASVKDLCLAYDPEGWAETLAGIGVQLSSIFVKCGLGYSYYRKGTYRVVHPELPDGVDMVEDQVAAFHQRGIKAIGYYYTFSSNRLGDQNPEWLLINEQGRPDGDRELSGLSMCLVGPFRDEYMIPQIREIVSLYDLDGLFFDGTFAKGICYCDSCRKRFQEDTGLELQPSEDPVARRKYNDWRLKEYRKLRTDIADAIHEIKPEFMVSFNASYVPRQPEAVPDQVDSLIIDVYPYNQTFQGSYHASCFAMSGKPFDIMNTAFLDWWGDWGCKPAIAMQQEVAPVLAYGGIPWPGYQMSFDYSVPDTVMKEFGNVLDFVEEREELVKDTEPVPYAAILINTVQPELGNHFKEPYDSFLDERRFHAIHRLLLEEMVPHHFVSEDILQARMDEFKVIILSDQRCLTPALVEALSGWVERGGVLVATELSGVDAQLDELLGIKVTDQYSHSHGYIEVLDDSLADGTLSMPHLAEAPFFRVTHGVDVDVLANLRGVYLRDDGRYLRRLSPPNGHIEGPAITTRTVGSGKAVYLAGDLFSAYANKNQWNLKLVIGNLLKSLISEKETIKVESSFWLEAIAARKRSCGSHIVHLVNHHGSYYENDQIRFLAQEVPVENVTVRIPVDERPERISVGPESHECRWEYDGKTVRVTGISVRIHNAISIEFGDKNIDRERV